MLQRPRVGTIHDFAGHSHGYTRRRALNLHHGQLGVCFQTVFHNVGWVSVSRLEHDVLAAESVAVLQQFRGEAVLFYSCCQLLQQYEGVNVTTWTITNTKLMHAK